MHQAWNAAPAVAPPASPGASPARVSSLEAVRFVFRAPDWPTNVLLSVVFLLIPIVGPIVLAGYLCEVHQRLTRRHPQPMPKLDFADFGHYLGRGVAPFVVGLVVMTPVLLASYAAAGGAVFGAVVVARRAGELWPALLVALPGGAFALLLWAVMSVFSNAAQTRAELTEDIGQALSVSEVLRYARATYKLALVKSITFGFLSAGVMLLGLLACYFGVYPALAIVQIAGMHLRHQIYEAHLARGGTPIVVRPPVWLPSEARLAPRYAAY